jgi:hypothetical protein
MGLLEDSVLVREHVGAGVVDWSGSPFAWMVSNGPVTKNLIGRELMHRWLLARPGNTVEVGPGGTDGYHFLVNGQHRVAVHFGMVGKEGDIRFSALRESGMGTDYMLCLGIEPYRARVWRIHPEDVVELPTFKGDIEGLHSLSFDPEDVPPWLASRQLDEVDATWLTE